MIAFVEFALTSLREAFNAAFSGTNLNARTLVPPQYADADTPFTRGATHILDGKRYYVHPEVVVSSLESYQAKITRSNV